VDCHTHKIHEIKCQTNKYYFTVIDLKLTFSAVSCEVFAKPAFTVEPLVAVHADVVVCLVGHVQGQGLRRRVLVHTQVTLVVPGGRTQVIFRLVPTS